MSDIDLFVSHSSGDADVARELRVELEKAGYTCWMAPDDVVGTGAWTEQILDAIESSRAMLILVSARANESAHVSREVNLAIGRNHAVLPIRIEPVNPDGSLEYLLSLVQRVDAFPPPISAHKDQILRRVAAMLKQAKAAEAAGTASPPGAAPSAGSPAPAGSASPETPTEETASRPTRPTGEERAEPAPPEPAPPEAAPLDLTPSDVTPAPIAAGTQIAGFTIEALLGEGGMATVYRAVQSEPKREVAIKVIRADHAADQTYRRRFLAEKDTLANLEHPSIVPIYAAGEAGGRLYIAMRLLDGVDLGERIAAEGRLRLHETIELLRPIADAVDYAHAKGIVHRDLKPSNIVLDHDGRPYLTDFGLGKQIGAGTEISSPGIAIGTIAYMAPEQFAGSDDPTHASAIDIYAFGCVVFTCLTGAPPFAGDNPLDVMNAHANAPAPSVRPFRPDVPPDVDAVIRRALAKDPGDRFATAGELVDGLAAAAGPAGATETVVVAHEATTFTGRLLTLVGTHLPVAVIGSVLGALALVTLAAAFIGLGNPQPSSSPIAQGTPGPSPGRNTDRTTWTSSERLLFDQLPEVARTDTACGPWVPGDDSMAPDRYAAAIAKLACASDAGGDVHYALFSSRQALDEEYAAITKGVGVATGGDCATTAPGNHKWQFPGGNPAGELACFARSSQVGYVWSVYELRVLGDWLAPTNRAGSDFQARWRASPNVPERELLAILPDFAGSASTCRRADDAYFVGAIATLECPAPTGKNLVFYAYFAQIADMDTDYRKLLSDAGQPETTQGCWDVSPANRGWAYLDDPDLLRKGSYGCYMRTDSTGIWHAWTTDRIKVLVVWLAPTREDGDALFQSFIKAIRTP